MSAFPELPETPQRVSREEYLDRERNSETRSEYFGGLIIAMSGGSLPHDRIEANVVGELHAQLKGKRCQVFTSNRRVRVVARDRDYYPDVSVVCGEPRLDESKPPALLNPIVAVEVISTTTERIDRGDKMRGYQAIPTMEAYLLVLQDEPLVEMYRRTPDGWLLTTTEGLDSVIELPIIECRLRLADVYDRVPLPTVTDIAP